jgi:hypothetical protein
MQALIIDRISMIGVALVLGSGSLPYIMRKASR